MTCDRRSGVRPQRAPARVGVLPEYDHHVAQGALSFAKAEHARMEREVMMARSCLERLRECYTEDLRHQQGLINKLEEIVKLVPK